jgi:predicted RNase H-like HicB family nuclease
MNKKEYTVFVDGKEYSVLLEESIRGRFTVSCPAFQGCIRKAHTLEKALYVIQDAIRECIKDIEKETDVSQITPYMAAVSLKKYTQFCLLTHKYWLINYVTLDFLTRPVQKAIDIHVGKYVIEHTDHMINVAIPINQKQYRELVKVYGK